REDEAAHWNLPRPGCYGKAAPSRSDRLHASPTRLRDRPDVQRSVNLRCEVTALIVLEAQALQAGYRLDRRVLVANPDSLQRTARGAKLEPCTRGLERPPSEHQRPKA